MTFRRQKIVQTKAKNPGDRRNHSQTNSVIPISCFFEPTCAFCRESRLSHRKWFIKSTILDYIYMHLFFHWWIPAWCQSADEKPRELSDLHWQRFSHLLTVDTKEKCDEQACYTIVTWKYNLSVSLSGAFVFCKATIFQLVNSVSGSSPDVHKNQSTQKQVIRSLSLSYKKTSWLAHNPSDYKHFISAL